MPIKYVGRNPIFRGRPLFEIVRQLQNLGEGRVVYRWSLLEDNPNEKTFVRLKKVIPDMAHPVSSMTF